MSTNTAAEKASTAAVDFFQKVKQRGEEVVKTSVERSTDFLYTAEARWKDLKVQDVVAKGARKTLAAVGMIQETKVPPALRRRERSFVVTRRVLEHIHNEFEGLTKDTEALAHRFESLCSLLNKFRVYCDAQVVEAEGGEGGGESEGGGSEDFVDVADPKSTSPGGGAEAAANAALEDDQESNEGIALFRRKMRALLSELRETVSVNCCGLTQTAMKDMDEAYRVAVKATDSAASAVDFQQLTVQNANQELQREKGRLTKFHEDDPNSAPVHIAVRHREAKLVQAKDELAELQASYREAVRSAGTSLFFAQEQTSMSTWSAYQILFSQMTHFFADASSESASISKTLTQLKNRQQVSLKISAEKRMRIEENTAAAQSLAMDRVLFGSPSSSREIPQSTRAAMNPPLPVAPAPVVELFSTSSSSAAAPPVHEGAAATKATVTSSASVGTAVALAATAPPPTADDAVMDEFDFLVQSRVVSSEPRVDGGGGPSSPQGPASAPRSARGPPVEPQWEDIFS